MAPAAKFQKVFQKLPDIGRADKILEPKLTDAPAQENPEVCIVENAKLPSRACQQVIAEIMKCGRVDVFTAQQPTYTITHLCRGIFRVGECENLLRASVTALDQPCNPVRQNRSLPRARSRHHQHGAVHVLDGLPLWIVGDEWRCT